MSNNKTNLSLVKETKSSLKTPAVKLTTATMSVINQPMKPLKANPNKQERKQTLATNLLANEVARLNIVDRPSAPQAYKPKIICADDIVLNAPTPVKLETKSPMTLRLETQPHYIKAARLAWDTRAQPLNRQCPENRWVINWGSYDFIAYHASFKEPNQILKHVNASITPTEKLWSFSGVVAFKNIDVLSKTAIILAVPSIKVQYREIPITVLHADNPQVGFTDRELYDKVQKYYADYIKSGNIPRNYGSAYDCDIPAGMVYNALKGLWECERSHYC